VDKDELCWILAGSRTRLLAVPTKALP